jgi:hypothetical protein
VCLSSIKWIWIETLGKLCQFFSSRCIKRYLL